MSQTYRSTLPIVQPGPRPAAMVDARDTDRPAGISPIRPPAGAPNVLSSCLTTWGSAHGPPLEGDTPDGEDYHVSVDIADRPIGYVREQQAITPDKPFLTYLAFGATHAPHHAPKEHIDSYRVPIDQGRYAQRVATLARQKQMGIVAQDAELITWPEGIAARSTTSPG
ncbi:MAG: hypothetical protein ACK5KU_00230 [Beutenbergiaceae bacterium]